MPVGYTQNNSNNIDYRSNDEKVDNNGRGGGAGWGVGGGVEDNFKIRAKTRR